MKIHQSWRDIIHNAYSALQVDYRVFLETDKGYFPDYDNFLNAFKTLPLDNTKAILFGQDPYPRKESAIGYAFIDAKVKEIFGKSGLSKEVNRATSLRNFIKMLLLANGSLGQNSLTQESIASLNKNGFIKSIIELKNNFEREGILLLNSSLVFESKERSVFHAKMFEPFMRKLLHQISDKNIELILFGNLAKNIKKLLPLHHSFKLFESCHPYNLQFITDKNVQNYFDGKCLLLSKDNG